MCFPRDLPWCRASHWPPHGGYHPARRRGELQAPEDSHQLEERQQTPRKPRGPLRQWGLRRCRGLESVRTFPPSGTQDTMPHATGLKVPITSTDRRPQGCGVAGPRGGGRVAGSGRGQGCPGPRSYDAGDPASPSAQGPRKAVCSLWRGAGQGLLGPRDESILSSADNCSPFER